MTNAAKSKLAEMLARPPSNWVDVVMIAVIKDPQYYGAFAVVGVLILALIALWATRQLINSIDKEERRRNKNNEQKKRD